MILEIKKSEENREVYLWNIQNISEVSCRAGYVNDCKK
jgi:hypothetical protein